METKQVEKEHYNFEKYVNKTRWISIWHQLNEVISLNPASVLEIGVGTGIFKNLLSHYGIKVKTVDIDPDLHPDYLASATKLPFSESTFDCVCAFQVLEHMPYNHSITAFSEMVRVSKRYIVLSLPDAKPMWRYSLHIPGSGPVNILVPIPCLPGGKENIWDEHYWEINVKNYHLRKVVDDFSKPGAKMIRTFRVPEKTYWRFFVFEKEIQEHPGAKRNIL